MKYNVLQYMILQVVCVVVCEVATAAVSSVEWFEECSHPNLSQTPPLLPPCECYGTKKSITVATVIVSLQYCRIMHG